MRITNGRQIYTVTEVTSIARQNLEMLSFWIEGEISSFRQVNPNYRYIYFDLKDPQSEFKIACILDPQVYKEENLALENNLKVLALGNLTLWEKEAKFQFYIHKLEETGIGILQIKLDQITRKLKNEGLFDPKHKKQLPIFPKKICVVTSYGSDAWNDFKKHTIDKFPQIELFVANIQVQGSRSIKQIVKALPKIDKLNFDIVVITRGGGSLEDLSAFNDEQVARAIFKMNSPTVVAIGHEINESLAEWVADIRASTPTDAAHTVTKGYLKAIETIENQKKLLISKANYYFSFNFQKLDYMHNRLSRTKYSFRDLFPKLEILRKSLENYKRLIYSQTQEKLTTYIEALKKNMVKLKDHKREKLKSIQKFLYLLSPKNTLDRGYSITRNQKGEILKSASSIVIGSIIGVELKHAKLISIVKSKQNV